MARNSSLIYTHDHDNYEILQLLTVDDNGNLLFNGKLIQGGSSNGITDTGILFSSSNSLIKRHEKYEEEKIANIGNPEAVLELSEINSSDLINFANNATEL